MKKAKAAKVAVETKAVEGPQVMGRERDGEPDKYEVEDAVRTLTRAEEIKKNAKLMPHVHKHIGKQMHSLKELKKLANEKKMEEAEGEDC